MHKVLISISTLEDFRSFTAWMISCDDPDVKRIPSSIYFTPGSNFRVHVQLSIPSTSWMSAIALNFPDIQMTQL